MSDFGSRIGKIVNLNRPQLWAFKLQYGEGIGWTCSIQESRFVGAHFGTGKSWREAMDKAIASLEKADD